MGNIVALRPRSLCRLRTDLGWERVKSWSSLVTGKTKDIQSLAENSRQKSGENREQILSKADLSGGRETDTPSALHRNASRRS